MKSYETKMGKIEAKDDELILFENGIPGFDYLKKFYLQTNNETHPIMWLLSLEDKEVAFPVIPPTSVRIDYSFDIPKDIVEYLEVKEEKDLLILSILTIRDKIEDLTINLAGPLVISLINKKGVQLILDNSQYSIRHSFEEEINRSKEIASEINKGGE